MSRERGVQVPFSSSEPARLPARVARWPPACGWGHV